MFVPLCMKNVSASCHSSYMVGLDYLPL